MSFFMEKGHINPVRHVLSTKFHVLFHVYLPVASSEIIIWKAQGVPQ